MSRTATWEATWPRPQMQIVDSLYLLRTYAYGNKREREKKKLTQKTQHSTYVDILYQVWIFCPFVSKHHGCEGYSRSKNGSRLLPRILYSETRHDPVKRFA